MHLLQLTMQSVIACHNPNPFEWTLIISLASAVSIFSVLSGAALTTVSTTIVSMLLAGAKIGAILAVIAADAASSQVLMGLVTTLVLMIQGIMGC